MSHRLAGALYLLHAMFQGLLDVKRSSHYGSFPAMADLTGHDPRDGVGQRRLVDLVPGRAGTRTQAAYMWPPVTSSIAGSSYSHYYKTTYPAIPRGQLRGGAG